MSYLHTVYRFLGSLWCAIFLMFSLLGLIIFGTFVESYTESHYLSEKWVYSSPFFKIILGGLFINILFSSLQRYPFRKGHIPFLITHLGLLLIILGVILKNYYGLQGVISLREGEEKNRYFLPHTLALHIQTPFSQNSYPVDLGTNAGFKEIPRYFDHIRVSGFAPHGKRLYLVPAWKEKGILEKPPEEMWILNGGFGGYAVKKEEDFFPLVIEAFSENEEDVPFEKRRPVLHCTITLENKRQELHLLFDSIFSGTTWVPFFKGQFLAALQEEEEDLPFSVRLKKAETEFYPYTEQPAAYKAELIVTPLLEKPYPVKLLMNQPHETKEGFLLYLSQIEGEPGRNKHIAITLSYDPFKKWATYPGILLTVLGALLLFFKRPRS